MRLFPTFAVAIFLIVAAGCDSTVDSFPPNRVHAFVVETSRRIPTATAAEETTQLVTEWFGTPIEPRWPVERFESDAAKSLVDLDNLLRASGQVRSDQKDRHFGLFREHCVTCHGISGGGDGPASLLQNPYPRDFRAGVYKWKSTERGSKPTRKDLKAILVNGAPGSAMPSFSAIEEEDIEALVDYVIYLSIRGEFERRLLYQAVDELGYEGESPEVELSLASAASFGVHADNDSGSEAYWVARDNLNRILEQWVGAEDSVVQVPAPTAKTAASIDQGRQLFHGKIANCSGCHGTDGLGGVPIIDFDDWTKEFTTRLAITPTDKDAVRPFRKLGALRPRQIKPRRIAGGWFHGGGDGETLYRRFTQGIAGTPMPGQILTEEASSTSLSPSQVWSIVHYVQSLAGDGS